LTGDKELTDYLNSKGEILYSDLVKDEIAKVDQLLVKESKKEGQVGGRSTVDKTGYQLLTERPSDLFQLEASYLQSYLGHMHRK
jgi:hypothetical protein